MLLIRCNYHLLPEFHNILQKELQLREAAAEAEEAVDEFIQALLGGFV